MRGLTLFLVVLTALAPGCASCGAVGVGTVTDVVPPPNVVPNSVVRLNPKTLKPVQVVAVGDAPDLVVAAGGYIWVTHHILRDQSSEDIVDTGDRTLTRVNPATGQATVVGNGLAPCGLSADPPGAVLVANCFPLSSGQGSYIDRVDAKTLRFTGSWPVPGGHDFFRGVGYGGGWVWTDGASANTVIRINPRTGAEQSIPVGRNGGAFAFAEAHGGLWINNTFPGSLTRLRPQNGAASVFDTRVSEPVFPAVDGQTVWAGDWLSPHVERLDISGSHTSRTITLPVRYPYAGVWDTAVGAGYVWATTPRDGALWRIDPRTDRVKRIPMPYLPTGVTANAGGVWVTVRSGVHGPPAPQSPSDAENGAGVGVPDCVGSDMRIAIEVRRPSHWQLEGGWGGMHARSDHRVATIVLRNVSGHLCRFESAFDMTIYDRAGRIVGQWDDPRWFDGTYRPGTSGTFSLPDVYTCARPGPFWAFGAVGGYSARRHGLRLSDITCRARRGRS